MQNTEQNKRVIPTLKNMKQVYENYTQDDHQVWGILYDRQIKNIPKASTMEFVRGLEKVRFNKDEIPNFEETNKILLHETGWQLVAVEGIVDDKLFFELLSERKFPATTWLRKMEELDYLEEPDMFHDVFAHVPLLVNKPFTHFLQQLAQIGLQYIDNTWAIQLLSRIYWYTVEFGLILENNDLRIYGAGILSSAGETAYCLGGQPALYGYNVQKILSSAYRKDEYQERYFVINSFEELYGSIAEIKQKMESMVKEQLVG